MKISALYFPSYSNTTVYRNNQSKSAVNISFSGMFSPKENYTKGIKNHALEELKAVYTPFLSEHSSYMTKMRDLKESVESELKKAIQTKPIPKYNPSEFEGVKDSKIGEIYNNIHEGFFLIDKIKEDYVSGETVQYADKTVNAGFLGSPYPKEKMDLYARLTGELCEKLGKLTYSAVAPQIGEKLQNLYQLFQRLNIQNSLYNTIENSEEVIRKGISIRQEAFIKSFEKIASLKQYIREANANKEQYEAETAEGRHIFEDNKITKSDMEFIENELQKPAFAILEEYKAKFKQCFDFKSTPQIDEFCKKQKDALKILRSKIYTDKEIYDEKIRKANEPPIVLDDEPV